MVVDCLISPVKDIGKRLLTEWLWPDIIKPHFDYWWCFDKNIEELRDGISSLVNLTDEIKQRDLCSRGDEEWLEQSTKMLEESNGILPDNNIPEACKLISRYSMGKKAKKMADEIAKHKGNFNLTADPAPPAMRFEFHEWTMEFESRKSIEKHIIDSLKKSSTCMIGICGMGGLGKTIMAKRIGKTVQDEKLFEEVVMVTVSQKIDYANIRNEIAKSLGLKFDVTATKDILRRRIMNKKKKIIILDDVWESLKFEELGIPVESNFATYKVLFTTRYQKIFGGINNKIVVQLDFLKEVEATSLFEKKAGCSDYLYLKRLSREVVAQCKCLPIALVTVGVTLGETDMNPSTWEDLLSKLKQSIPTDLPQVLTDVYIPLKWSYDYLESNSQRDLFLMCCLFPDDYDIPIQQLTWYSMGLHLFEDINNNNVKDTKNRTQALIGKLRGRFLLIDGTDKLHVKMHDVMRDVAIYIGSKEKNDFLKCRHKTPIENSSDVDVNWMSVDFSEDGLEFPVLSRFPNLRLLMLQKLKSSSNELSDVSFEGMGDLSVLSFQSSSIGSLPPTLGLLLKKLRTLCLVNCEVGNISVIGELTSLEIFSCYECKNITELPTEMGRLSSLRLLELNECPKLQRIQYGIISRLCKLEELQIRRSFSEWKTGGEMGNAAVTELQSLPKLTCLEIEISDWNLAAQDLQLSSKLVQYWIRVGSDHNRFEQGDYRKVMILNLGRAVGNWIPLRARDAESLTLRGDGSVNINLAETADLMSLEFSECSTVKKLVDTKDGIVFPLLGTLRLNQLQNLEEIYERTIIPNQNDSLINLQSIEITSCPKLRSLFSVSVARRCLSKLEVLEIESCEAMKEVFWNEIRHDKDDCIFPKLKKLILVNLPNLTAFCEGLKNVNFPILTEMEIRNLPNLKDSVFPLNSETLCELKSIKIVSCSILGPLFSVLVATRCLIKLEVLEIEDCDKLEKVFCGEIRDNPDVFIELPKLKKLKLENLRNLTAFCQRENIIKFPNLTEMEIAYLPKLFSSGFRNTSR